MEFSVQLLFSLNRIIRELRIYAYALINYLYLQTVLLRIIIHVCFSKFARCAFVLLSFADGYVIGANNFVNTSRANRHESALLATIIQL